MKKKVGAKFNTPEQEKFVQAVLSLGSKEETQAFLSDMFTSGEIEEFSKRLLAAELLTKGVKYSAIEERTGFSSATVARASRCLKRDSSGFKSVLWKMHHWHTKVPSGERVVLMKQS